MGASLARAEQVANAASAKHGPSADGSLQGLPPPQPTPCGISRSMCHTLAQVPHQFAMADLSASVEVSLGRQGRLVIPATLRRSLGLEEGDRLVARQDGDRLVIEKPEQIRQRLKARFARVPAERRLVDELISERREESRREAEG